MSSHSALLRFSSASLLLRVIFTCAWLLLGVFEDVVVGGGGGELCRRERLPNPPRSAFRSTSTGSNLGSCSVSGAPSPMPSDQPMRDKRPYPTLSASILRQREEVMRRLGTGVDGSLCVAAEVPRR